MSCFKKALSFVNKSSKVDRHQQKHSSQKLRTYIKCWVMVFLKSKESIFYYIIV